MSTEVVAWIALAVMTIMAQRYRLQRNASDALIGELIMVLVAEGLVEDPNADD